MRSPRGWRRRALDISRGVQGRDRGTRRLGWDRANTHRADLQRQGALQRLHFRHPRRMVRRGRDPASGPNAAGRREAGQGRGGDEVAAVVAAVAHRPGPVVQPGSRPSSSRTRGADSLSWQPGGAGPEETRRGGACQTERQRAGLLTGRGDSSVMSSCERKPVEKGTIMT